MAKYSGINHLAMATRDMDTTIRFWRDLLGLRLVAGLGGMKDRNPSAVTMEGADPQTGCWPEVKRKTPLEDRDIFPGEGMVLSDLEQL